MYALTAKRVFGNSAFTPARKDVARIMDAKFYLVTLQDTETDQGDGHYLLDTETVFLMTGYKARQERDSHLNHCNRIREYDGKVYQLRNSTFPFYCCTEHDQLFTSEDAARVHFAKKIADELRRDAYHLAKCQRELDDPTTNAFNRKCAQDAIKWDTAQRTRTPEIVRIR